MLLPPDTQHFLQAYERIKNVVLPTPLHRSDYYAARYNCEVYFKREDLQLVRSYKIRGAYHLISRLSAAEQQKGVVCASAGNHAQGVAYSCKLLGIKGVIFMPVNTPQQKIDQTKMYGAGYVTIQLTGLTFDACFHAAVQYAAAQELVFVPPFDHQHIIEGQGTVGIEIMTELPQVDYILLPVGGGGLCAGVSAYTHACNPAIRIIGAEPEGAASMTAALAAGNPVKLAHIDTFVDGAAVQRVGDLTFDICKTRISKMLTIPEGKICTTILDLYNKEGIITEPAAALSVAALDEIADEIAGKNVVCIISGSNNDAGRMQEIRERSLDFEGLKHHFLVQLPPGNNALDHFITQVVREEEIVRLDYKKRHSSPHRIIMAEIICKSKEHYKGLVQRMNDHHIRFIKLNDGDLLRYFE